MASLEPASSIKCVKRFPDNSVLEVSWGNGYSQVYPYVWLRDNCTCRIACWEATGKFPKAGSRFGLDVDVTPNTVEITGATPLAIAIEWSDGHKSEYSSDWLLTFKFDESVQDPIFSPKLRYWDANEAKTLIKKYDFNDLISSDKILLNWMTDLKELGIALVVNTPIKAEQLRLVGDRVNFLHQSHYGAVWKVEARFTNTGENDDHNVTYQSAFLPLHTDLSYCQRPPGIMMLHCIQSAVEGGDSILSDGFKAAEEMRQQHPQAFELLTSTIFEMFDKGTATDYVGKYHTRAKHPVIRLNSQGDIEQIVTGEHARTPILRVPVPTVLPIYRALKLFHDKLHDPANMFQFKLREGDIICVNNYRVLHGRTNFKVTKTTKRYLEGAFLEWDQVDIRMRVLKEEKNTNNIE